MRVAGIGRYGPSFHIVATFLWYRLVYYFFETGNALRRHWQLLLLIVGIFYAVIDFRSLAAPVLSVALDDAPPIGAFANIGLYHLVGLAWVTVQQRFVRGGVFAAYLQTLPMKQSQRQVVDLLVIVTANNALWAYLVLALAKAPYGEIAAVTTISLVVHLIVIGSVLVASQLIWLYHRVLAVTFLVIADSLLCWADAALMGIDRVFATIGLAVTVAVVAGKLAAPKRWPSNRWGIGIGGFGRRIRQSMSRHMPPAAILQAMLVFAEHGPETAMRAVLGTAVLTAGWAVVTYGGNTGIAPAVLLIADALMIPILSGTYRVLYMAHERAGSYTRSLPTSRHFWIVRDIVFVVSLSVCLLAPFLGTLFVVGAITWSSVLFVVVANVGLMSLFRGVLAYRGTHTVLISATIVVVWTVCAVHLINRI